MSVHKACFSLSTRARNDFKQILQYTIKTWSRGQAETYQAKLERALHAIAENPLLSPEHEGGVRICMAEHHRVFYRIEHDRIYIIRILHKRMKEALHL